MRLGGGANLGNWGGRRGGQSKGLAGHCHPRFVCKKIHCDTTTAGFAADLDHRPLSVRQDMCAACAAV